MERRLGLSTYGQACMQCYKAKCRCVPHPSGDGCERCLRLRKDCQPSDSARRRNAQRAEDSDVRIARLEGKIETLLSSMQSPPQYSYSPPDVSPTQAEQSLRFFRARMLPCFPFISLSPDITARQLLQDRPFLLQAILTVTTFSTQKRAARAEELKRTLFTSAFVQVQSNIDLLLGLLTYLAWSTDPFLGGADLVSRLVMLAISLVYDLRLFKPSPPDVKLIMTITQGRSYDENDQKTSEETVQDLMEKQRAVLACFVLSSNMSSHLGRLDPLRWTLQMEEALCAIGMNKSCATDEFFAFQVRLQLLKQRAAYIREQHEIERAHTVSGSATTSVPGLLYLKTLRGQLYELISSFPSDLHQREILIIYAQYVELYINQLAYSISSDSPLLTSSQRADGGLLPGFERLECLWQSVESIRSWVDNFNQIPPWELVGLPFHFWSQMILCITVLKYLSVLEDPAWDRQAVRNKVDLISTMDCMIQKLDLSSEEPGVQCEDNLFKLLSRLLHKCRAWAGPRWKVASPTADGDGSAHSDADSCNTFIPDLDQMGWIQSMDLESEQWFEDAMGWSTV